MEQDHIRNLPRDDNAVYLIAKYNPLKGPCFLIASTAYCEHVGVKRHEGEVRGEMHF